MKSFQLTDFHVSLNSVTSRGFRKHALAQRLNDDFDCDLKIAEIAENSRTLPITSGLLSRGDCNRD